MGVIDAARQLERGLAQSFPLGIAQVRGRCAFDYLLVTALHGTVALEQVHELPVLVAHDLDFDMAGTNHHLFQIEFVVAESRGGFTPCQVDGRGEFFRLVDRPHAAPAAAPARLEHQRVADIFGAVSYTHLFSILACKAGGNPSAG